MNRIRLVLSVTLLLVASGPPVGPAQAGTIRGSVSLQLSPERERPPRYHRGPYRAATGARRDAPNPLRSVVVYLENGPEGVASPSEAAVMRQSHDRFIPHVLPVLAGTTVEFPNDDDYYHNVFSIVAGDRFDLGRYGRGKAAEQVFDAPAVVVVRCEIHAGMKAFIVVLGNPHFTVPQGDGHYELTVPAGSYDLKAWHPTGGERRYQVEVPDDGAACVDIQF